MPAPVSRQRRLACGALVALLVAGCGPTSKLLRKELANGAPGKYIAGVPFERQQRNWCGPAALVSVARYNGLSLTQEEIASEVYLPSIGATLTLDLSRFARARGLWCHAGPGSREDVRTWLDRGVPVVALLRQNWLFKRTNHYIVVTGYHAGRRYFLAHTGYAPDRPISFGRFERCHKAAGGWILAAARPQDVDWPLTAAGHNGLGRLLERQGDLARAQDEHLKAIAGNPTHPIFHFNLGNLYAQRCSSEKAERAYRDAIRLEPDFADAHNNLAHVLLAQGRRDEARRQAERAVELGGPRVAYYHDTLGRVLLALGRPSDAEAAFRSALKSARGDADVATEAHLGLIEALVRAGRRDQAVAEKDSLLKRTADPAVRAQAEKLLE